MGGVWLDLKPEHIEFSDNLAMRRHVAAFKNNRPGKNGAPTTGVAAEAFNIMGARCECAAYLWAKPVKWHSFGESVRDLPDLDYFIDVKGVAQTRHSLIVQRHDSAEWAYLLVSSQEHPRYHLIGWMWGREAQQQKYWTDPVGGRAAYFVKPDDPALRSPGLLFDVLRAKQRSDAREAV